MGRLKPRAYHTPDDGAAWRAPCYRKKGQSGTEGSRSYQFPIGSRRIQTMSLPKGIGKGRRGAYNRRFHKAGVPPGAWLPEKELIQGCRNRVMIPPQSRMKSCVQLYTLSTEGWRKAGKVSLRPNTAACLIFFGKFNNSGKFLVNIDIKKPALCLTEG